MTRVNVTTIGFTKSSAEHFFSRLQGAGVKRLIDVRLHNTSQLAGFAKADDLSYLLMRLLGVTYVHEPLLAPTDHMLSVYKKRKGSWQTYELQFKSLMQEREIESRFRPEAFAHACLLCSEAEPHFCHRRLVCEYLNGKWGDTLSITHL